MRSKLLPQEKSYKVLVERHVATVLTIPLGFAARGAIFLGYGSWWNTEGNPFERGGHMKLKHLLQVFFGVLVAIALSFPLFGWMVRHVLYKHFGSKQLKPGFEEGSS